MRSLGVSLFVASMLCSGLAHADEAKQQSDEQKRADALFAEGRKLVEAHDDAGACAKFGEAIKLDPDAAGTMLNLGRCNENLKKYRTALYWFRKAQARAHETNLPDYEKAAGEHTTSLASLVATVKIAVTGDLPEAHVKIDGEEIKPDEYLHAEVDPGHHTLDAGAPGKLNVHQEFDVEGKGGQTLTITFVAGDNSVLIDRGAKRRKYALITAAAGGVLVVTSLIISAYAKLEYNKCIDSSNVPKGSTDGGHSDCPVADATAAISYDDDKWRLARDYATPIFIVGAAAFGVATYMYLTAPQKERVDRTVFVPTLTPDQVGFVVSGGF